MAITEKSAAPAIELVAEANEVEDLDASETDGASEALLALLAGSAEASAPSAIPERIHGVVVGRLLALEGGPLVAWPGAPDGARARAMERLEPRHVGGDVALMFEEGDPTRALIMGPVERFGSELSVTEEGEGEQRRVVLRADRELVLACGEASITLTRAGKVLIKGTYVSSHASGTQRIRGGTVEIN